MTKQKKKVKKEGQKMIENQKTKRYTDDEKQDILNFAEENTILAAVEKYGVSQASISNWRKGSNSSSKKSSQFSIEGDDVVIRIPKVDLLDALVGKKSFSLKDLL